jgi:hypothetical protein
LSTLASRYDGPAFESLALVPFFFIERFFEEGGIGSRAFGIPDDEEADTFKVPSFDGRFEFP